MDGNHKAPRHDQLQPGDWQFDQGLTDVANARGADLLLQEEPKAIIARIIDFEGREKAVERFAAAWRVKPTAAAEIIDSLLEGGRYEVAAADTSAASACPCFSQTCPLLVDDPECHEWAYGRHAPRIYPGAGEEDLLGVMIPYDCGEGPFNPTAFEEGQWKSRGCMPPKLWEFVTAVATVNGYARDYCFVRLTVA